MPSNVAPPVGRPLPRGWIVSRRDDLIWIQGSVVAGLALLAFFAFTPLHDGSYRASHPAVIALLLWGVLFDGTHVWGTYARSYLAPDEASGAYLPGSWSWALVVVGPALALLDHATLAQVPSPMGHAGWLFRGFLLVAYLWAYFHLVRQHYGFVVLYRRKEGSPGRGLDVIVLWAGCIYPYLRFSLSPPYARSGMLQTAPAVLIPSLRLAVDIGFALLGVALLVAWLVERRPGDRLGPKHLYLAIVIAFHMLVFATLDNLLTITATLTIFHNIQYHRIVWQYERGHNRVPSGTLSRYLSFGALLGLSWYGPRVMGLAIVASDLGRNILLGLGWGVAFHHYLVDGRIWKVRRARDVARALDAGAAT